jgi:hypothetical protein
MVSRCGAPQKSVNDAEEFSFASGEKEAIIVELKEEARILRARMEHNPEVKRHAGQPQDCMAPVPGDPSALSPLVVVFVHLVWCFRSWLF